MNCRKASEPFRDQGSSFQLEVDFLAQFNVPTQGHLTLKWEGKDRWRSEVVIGGFEQITVRKDDRLYCRLRLGDEQLHFTVAPNCISRRPPATFATDSTYL